MSTKFNSIRFIDRLNDDTYNITPNVSEPIMCLASTKDVLDEDLGVVVKKTVKQVYDPRTELKKYKVSDFALENIIASGAYDMLKEIHYSSSVDSHIEHVSSSLEKLTEKANNVEQSNK